MSGDPWRWMTPAEWDASDAANREKLLPVGEAMNLAWLRIATDGRTYQQLWKLGD